MNHIRLTQAEILAQGPVGKKTCLDCEQVLSLLLFNHFRKKIKSGEERIYYNKYCKECERTRRKAIMRKHNLRRSKKCFWNPYGNAVGEHNGSAKVTEDVVIFMRSPTGLKAKNTILGRMFGLHESSVALIKSGRNWKHIIGSEIKYREGYTRGSGHENHSEDRGQDHCEREELPSLRLVRESGGDRTGLQEVSNLPRQGRDQPDRSGTDTQVLLKRSG